MKSLTPVENVAGFPNSVFYRVDKKGTSPPVGIREFAWPPPLAVARKITGPAGGRGQSGLSRRKEPAKPRSARLAMTG
jgi:hypothetical protein